MSNGNRRGSGNAPAWNAGGALGTGCALLALSGLLGLVLAAPAAAGDETGWRVVREEDGITVSRRDGSDTPAFRGVTVVEAGLPRVLAVLGDVPRHVEWRSRCTESRVLDQEPNGDLIIYTRMQGTWPVSDRDAVLRSVTEVDGADSVSISLHNVETPLAPDPDGAVRMPLLDGRYALRALGPERTRVEYRMNIDLGGAVPGWIVRYVAEDMPFETLAGLRRQVERTEDVGVYGAFARAWRTAASRGEIPSIPALR